MKVNWEWNIMKDKQSLKGELISFNSQQETDNHSPLKSLYKL